MIICNSKKFIYIHIPKCGGTTISSVLERNLLAQDITLNLNPHAGWQQFVDAYRKKFGLFKHSTAGEIAKAMTPEHFREYFVFTFCRNPFARAYSAYTFTLKSDARYRPQSGRYQEIRDMSFEEFLQSRYVQNREMLQTRMQSRWLRGTGKQVHAYKLENAGTALGELMARFYGKTGEGVDVPRKNSSTGVDEWKTMSSTAEDMIRSLYAEDFKAFGYPERIER